MAYITTNHNVGKAYSLGIINTINTPLPKSFGVEEKKGHYKKEELNKIMDIVSIQMIDMGIDDIQGVVSRLVMVVLDSCFEIHFSKFELNVDIEESDEGYQYKVYDSIGIVSAEQWVAK